MAEKHEKTPTQAKTSEFRRIIELGSASSWNVFERKLFGVLFEKDQYDEIPPEVSKYSEMDDGTSFVEGKIVTLAILIIDFKAMRAKAKLITSDILHRYPSFEFDQKVAGNPLTNSFEKMGAALLQHGNETNKRKSNRKKDQKPKPDTTQQSSTESIAATMADGDEAFFGPRPSNTVPITPQKRNFSGTSFGTASTETTPNKFTKPEPTIQELQMELVRDVVRCIYRSSFIPVRWVQGRELKLLYQS